MKALIGLVLILLVFLSLAKKERPVPKPNPKPTPPSPVPQETIEYEIIPLYKDRLDEDSEYANVMNRKIKRVENPQEAGALGAGIIAKLALGEITDTSGIKEYCHYDKEFSPDPKYRKLYDNLYKEFNSTCTFAKDQCNKLKATFLNYASEVERQRTNATPFNKDILEFNISISSYDEFSSQIDSLQIVYDQFLRWIEESLTAVENTAKDVSTGKKNQKALSKLIKKRLNEFSKRHERLEKYINDLIKQTNRL